MARHDICIVGLKCYDLLSGSLVPKYLGGIEKLLVSLARELSRSGLSVSFITYDEGQSEVEIIDGITVYKAFSLEDGVPGLRFVFPRMTGLWSAMRKADSNIYLQMGAGSETGIVALGCKFFAGKGKRPFVFSLASDKDAAKAGIAKLSKREQILYQYGINNADTRITQTLKQAERLQTDYGLESITLPMPIESPKAFELSERLEQRTTTKVLWVGRIIETKRLEFLFEVARHCPGIEFDVVGTPNNYSAYYDGLVSQADSIPNVRLHGKVAEGILPELYQQASLLACTSVLEGFPTTFLESWSYGVPVVTTFDPDGVVATNDLGIVVKETGQMAEAIKDISSDKGKCLSLGNRARKFFLDNYTFDSILPRYKKLFSKLIQESI